MEVDMVAQLLRFGLGIVFPLAVVGYALSKGI
jgi:hypothetical protein